MDTVTLELYLKEETARAYNFLKPSKTAVWGKLPKWHWLPKSQVKAKIKKKVNKGMDLYSVTIPRWLAEKKGLV